MAFDLKKEFKALYLPPTKPVIVNVPSMNFIAVSGKGNPNEENSEYKRSIEQLYGVAYTLKMSYKSNYKIDGFFEYVVPPLEGLWWTDSGVFDEKSLLRFTSMIRLPDFITNTHIKWAIEEVERKKKQDCSVVKYLNFVEGLCVQCMHIGSYDEEPKTIATMTAFAKEQGYEIAIDEHRKHHEIYLNDPRKISTDKLKTVLRYPIK